MFILEGVLLGHTQPLPEEQEVNDIDDMAQFCRPCVCVHTCVYMHVYAKMCIVCVVMCLSLCGYVAYWVQKDSNVFPSTES